jgi:hypothetical protein
MVKSAVIQIPLLIPPLILSKVAEKLNFTRNLDYWKDFKCVFPGCAKMYKRRSSWIKHLIQKHQTEWPKLSDSEQKDILQQAATEPDVPPPSSASPHAKKRKSSQKGKK